MRIITIDEKKLILRSLKNKLSEFGYDVKTARTGKKGIELLQTFKPDLITIDINMSWLDGLDVLKYIKESNLDTKVIVISSDSGDEMLLELFDYGIEDYIKKPAPLSEIVARINRVAGKQPISADVLLERSSVIRNKCVGVVIPCYNEEDRLLSDEFTNFVKENSGYYLCFVNDGSTDKTLDVLNELRKGREEYIGVYNCDKNGGKAEAVRQGMLHLLYHKELSLDYIGFLDADLSTDFEDFDNLVRTLESTKYKIVSGSRIERVGANINKESARQLISYIINLIIRQILGMNFKDTQCGAKVMKREVIPVLFRDKFITRWLFDVEMFLRLKKSYGEKAKKLVYEQPLNRWVHADGSKLSMRDSLKIGSQLFRIAAYYR